MRYEARPSPAIPVAPVREGRIRFDFAANSFAVRAALEAMLTELALAGVASDDRVLCEIVLAEVLNNVVEHAYGRAGGWIEMEAEVGPETLGFMVWDWGRGMPGDVLPEGQLRLAADELPEGGFGWHLIRALSASLEHGREGGRNWLRFVLNREQTELTR